MRVVHIFKDYHPPTTGGVEQHMRLLCSALARHVDVTVLVPSRSLRTLEERLDGVDVIRVPEFGRYASAPLCPTLPWRLRRLRPDLVHVHFPNPMGDLGYLLSGTPAPLVVTYHADIVKQRLLLPLYTPVVRALFRRAGRVIATSAEYVASSRFLSRYGAKCTIIPLGVDPASLALRDGESEAVAALRGERPYPVILFVGTLRYYKGLDVLVHAMTEVDGRALIVGRGRDETLKQLAQRLGVLHRIELMGEVSASRLRILLHAADVFVLPSIDRCEAFGIAQLEAMACGTPVVSSDLPTGVRFVNRHEETGLLVPPGDPKALAAALNRLLNDPGLRARLAEAGRARVEQEFTAERMVRRTLDVYEEVLARRQQLMPHRRRLRSSGASRPECDTPAHDQRTSSMEHRSRCQPAGRMAEHTIMRARVRLVALWLLLCVMPSPALAYVDVTGSYLVAQLVLAGAAGVMVVLRVFASRIRNGLVRWVRLIFPG